MLARKESWPFIPELHLFHSETRCERFLRKKMRVEPEFVYDAGAQVWCKEGVAAVLMRNVSKDEVEELSMLVHEAVHVVLMHFDYLGEDDLGQEIVAYGVQTVSDALMSAHKRWKRGKRHKKS